MTNYVIHEKVYDGVTYQSIVADDTVEFVQWAIDNGVDYQVHHYRSMVIIIPLSDNQKRILFRTTFGSKGELTN